MRIFEITLFSNFKAPCSVFYVCTVFPFGRKRNKPMCYIITLLPTEEMYKVLHYGTTIFGPKREFKFY